MAALTEGDQRDQLITTFDPRKCFQSVDIVLIPAGSKWALAYNRLSRTAIVVPRQVAGLLVHCREFKVLEEHADEYVRDCLSRNLEPATVSAGSSTHVKGQPLIVETTLQELVNCGFLTSAVDAMQLCRSLNTSNDSSPVISTIGITTRDRPETFGRALPSYLRMCAQFGRQVGFVIIDLSVRDAVHESNRKTLRSLASRYGYEFLYADRGDIRKFVGEISRKGDLSPDAVEFCLADTVALRAATKFSVGDFNLSDYGAGMNALLLHTAGEMVLDGDDDTLCVGWAPESPGGLALSSSQDPTEYWFFNERDAALRSSGLTEQDLVKSHEELLGKSVGTCIAPLAQSGELGLADVAARFIRRVSSGKGVVRVTSTGVIGDSGLGSPLGYLMLRGNSWRRLTRTEREYQDSITQRAVLRTVMRRTIGESLPCITSGIGLDNRTLLPPFGPLGRNGDGIFAATLRTCFPNAFVGFIPFALMHDPLEARSFTIDYMFKRAAGFVSGQILVFLIDAFGKFPAPSRSNERLQRLGTSLCDLGSMQLRDFEEVLRVHLWRVASACLSKMEQRLAEEHSQPRFWALDLERVMTTLRNAMPTRRFVLPQDFADLCSDDDALTAMQKLVYMHGVLLQRWPAMVEVARALRSEGRSLAHPV